MNKSDTEKTVCGVPGRLTHATVKPGQAPGLWFKQRWISNSRPCDGYEPGSIIRAEIRFDDELGNGHNSFAVTGTIYGHAIKYRGSYRREEIAGGCCHEEIAKAFPELAHLIKWHLFDQTGPMHYVANTVYHAGNRDHWGKLKGEPHQWETVIQFGNNPIKYHGRRSWNRGAFMKFLQEHRPLFSGPAFDFEVLPIYHEDQGKPGKYQFGPQYTFGGFADKWSECPFDTEAEALDFLYALNNCDPKFVKIATAWGEGKERDLAAARSCAVWPEATDAELSADKETLTAALLARRPALVAAFRAEIEAAGFEWEPSEQVAA